MKEYCDQMQDEWAALIESRILSVFDLPPADAIYHPDFWEGNKFLPAS